MKLLRIFIVTMLFAVSCSFGAAGVYADENISEKALEITDVSVPFDSGSELDAFGSVSYKKHCVSKVRNIIYIPFLMIRLLH